MDWTPRDEVILTAVLNNRQSGDLEIDYDLLGWKLDITTTEGPWPLIKRKLRDQDGPISDTGFRLRRNKRRQLVAIY